MKTAIKTKKQYELAKFLNKNLKHKHNWKRFRSKPKRGHKIGKTMEDSTGGFLKCSICDECVFVSKKNLDKYKPLVRSGAKTHDIIIVRKQTYNQ